MRVGFVVISRRFIRQPDVAEMKVGRLRSARSWKLTEKRTHRTCKAEPSAALTKTQIQRKRAASFGKLRIAGYEYEARRDFKLIQGKRGEPRSRCRGPRQGK
jgi:hypothetical protein